MYTTCLFLYFLQSIFRIKQSWVVEWADQEVTLEDKDREQEGLHLNTMTPPCAGVLLCTVHSTSIYSTIEHLIYRPYRTWVASLRVLAQAIQCGCSYITGVKVGGWGGAANSFYIFTVSSHHTAKYINAVATLHSQDCLKRDNHGIGEVQPKKNKYFLVRIKQEEGKIAMAPFTW